MLSGVPDSTDGLMLGITERAGGRVINPDRMWHYPEGVINHSPVWTSHGIRILSGPSPLWLDARGHRLPTPLFPGFDALGALQHILGTGYAHSWFLLDAKTIGAEFGLSGSEQNPDFSAKSVKLLLTTRAGGKITPPLQAFLDKGVDFLTADTVPELVGKMNALAGETIDRRRRRGDHGGVAGRPGRGRDWARIRRSSPCRRPASISATAGCAPRSRTRCSTPRPVH